MVFFYRNLLSISQDGVAKIMDVLLDCLSDENVEVREMASKVLSGVVRCSQRQSIVPLKVEHFVVFLAHLPADLFILEPLCRFGSQNFSSTTARSCLRECLAFPSLGNFRNLCAHRKSSILGWSMDATSHWRCVASAPPAFFSDESLVLAPHATDPPPISTTVRKCASEFKKVDSFLLCGFPH